MENTFTVTIKETSKELTKRERIMYKDTTEAIPLDVATQEVFEGEFVTIEPVGYVVLGIHNENTDDKDYDQYLIIDAEGNRYITGSNAFWGSFKNIWDEMTDNGTDFEPFQIRVVRKESKNYKGKSFLKAVLI